MNIVKLVTKVARMKKIIGLNSLIILALLLNGCAPIKAIQPIVQSTTPDPVQPVPATSTSRPATATASPSEVVNECLNCHSDKERLMALAKEEETSESESRGVG